MSKFLLAKNTVTICNSKDEEPFTRLRKQKISSAMSMFLYKYPLKTHVIPMFVKWYEAFPLVLDKPTWDLTVISEKSWCGGEFIAWMVYFNSIEVGKLC